MIPIGQHNNFTLGVSALKENINLIISGPSGFGKTHLATHLAKKCGIRQSFFYASPPDMRRNWLLDSYKVVLVVDEIHASKEQINWVLFLDKYSGRVIFTTTNPEEVIEPLRNRCMRLDILPYTEEQLLCIGGDFCTPFIVSISRGVPRTVIQMTKMFRGKEEEHIINLLGLVEDSGDLLYPTEYQYLKTLRNLGGTASKSTLESMLKMDITEVERGLLFLNRIRISSRGRNYV